MTFIQLLHAIYDYYSIMGFAENVRNEMSYQDIKIKELAEKTQISKNTIDKYLSGKKVQPSVENAVKIAQALNVTVEYLVCNVNEKTSEETHQKLKKFVPQYQKLNDFNQKTVNDLIVSLLSRQ